MAQLGARLHGMQKVWGSSPHGSITYLLICQALTADHPAVISQIDTGTTLLTTLLEVVP